MRRKNNPTVGFTLTQIAEGFVNEDAAEEWQARTLVALWPERRNGREAQPPERRVSWPTTFAARQRRSASLRSSRKRSGGQRGRRK